MGRPRADFPKPGKRQRGRCWQIFWRVGQRSRHLSIGAVGEEEAETPRMEVPLALRTGEWAGRAASKAPAGALRRAVAPTVARLEQLAARPSEVQRERAQVAHRPKR